MSEESLPPGSVPVSAGDVLDQKYRVDRVLGVGGMGVVVAATHLQLAQKVALKFMLPAGLRHPGLVERFSREARAAARLKSDHVARVLDVGTLSSGSPYMVMEFLEGSDLATVVESGGPIAVEMAVDCVLQACDAVAEAHAVGIVHRDLKPRNLFLTQRNDGRALVKVLDFGISKDRSAADLGLTRTAEIIGSPNYMSPEQLKSTRLADERSDIWALGVILYELLTGAVPFVAESITQLTAMVLTEPPRPLLALRPEIPRDLARVVERCLEKEPERRFASVAELAAALERFAPADSRELARRIARIASSSRAPGDSSRASARVPVPGGTSSVSWTERTELAPSKGKKVAVASVAVVTLVAAASLGGVAFFRWGRGGAAGGAGAGVIAGAGVSSTGVSASAATASAPSARPAVTLAPIAPASESPPAGASPSGPATASAPPAAPPGPGRAPRPKRGEPGPAGTANEAPQNRTSW